MSAILKHVCFFFSCIWLVTGCSKDYPSLPFDSTDTGLPGDVESLWSSGGDTVYACGGVLHDGWIAQSSDRGINWQVMERDHLNPFHAICFSPAGAGYMADADVLIFSSHDQGQSWQQYYPSTWPLNVNRNLRNIHFASETLGFVCGGKNLGNGLIYRTTDGGQTWDFTEVDHELRGVCMADSLIGFAVGYGVCLKTLDGGTHWQLDGGKREYYTATSRQSAYGIFRVTLDGQVERAVAPGWQWNQLRKATNGAFSDVKISCMDVTTGGRIVIAGFNGFISSSNDNGASWSDFRMFGGSNISSVLIAPDGELLAAGENGTVFRTAMP